jgi:type IV pilus assembly protein PilY1
MKPRLTTILISLFLLFGLVSIPSPGIPAPYQCCSVPAVAGVATKPNVMIVMDYSGSMQFRAHWADPWHSYFNSNVAYGYSSNNNENDKVNGTYDPTRSYYGLFQSNVYYTYDTTNKYWVAASPQPVSAYSFTDKSSDGGPVPGWGSGRAYAVNALVSDNGNSYMCTTAHTSSTTSEPGSGATWTTYWVLAGAGNELIQLTAAGHNFQVGQLVEFQGLTSHTGMNGNAYYVTAVSGNTFKVAFPWNGNPDSALGSVQRRIPGTLLTTYGGVAQTSGLSGNILNYASASRIDCALGALIGGPGTCDTNYCYTRGQGERSYLIESTNVQAEFYVRPATSDSTATYPDDYSSGSYTGKTTYVSLNGRYAGSVTNADPTLGSVCTSQHCAGTSTCLHYACDDADCTHKPCLHQTCSHWSCTGRNCSDTRCQNNDSRCSNRTCDGYVCDQYGECDTCNNWQCDQWQCDNPVCDTWSNTGNYYEAWTFTTGSTATHIDVTLYGNWTNHATSYVGLFNSTNFSQNPVASNTAGSTTSPALLSVNLNANTTYYLVVSPTVQYATGTYTLSSSQELTGYDFRNPSNPSVAPGAFSGSRLMPPGFTVPIGSIPQAQVKIRMDKSARSGIIQQTFNSVRYGFMYYNTTSGNVGKILIGCDNTNLDNLLAAFNSIYPYNGTPTGQALQEAYDYFKQSNDHNANADNTNFINAGHSVDPYYQPNLSGTLVAVPCRKSYVVLISDGAWNYGPDGSTWVDPIVPARAMHANDLRTDLDGKQTVDVYSIFAFGTDSEAGRNSMKAIAAFGGFTDDSSCGTSGYPYNFTTDSPATEYTPTPTCEAPCVGSKTLRWPRSYCDGTVPLPSGHSYDTCCKEWDANWDKYTAGDKLDKGVPDNYFECSEGQDLQAALQKVLSGAIVKNATASAVATVAQETQEGDVIIRGLFHAADPDTVGRYLWRGHLEAYWPWLNQSDMTWHYDFETSPCFEITGTKNCWDGAEVLETDNSRTLYTWDPNASPPATITVPMVPRQGSAPFTPSNPPWVSMDSTTTTNWKNKLGLGTAPGAADLLDWVRGSDAPLGSTYTFRDRDNWRLGDIIYSTPVVVGTPSVGGVSTHDPNRDEFYAYRNRNDVYYRDKVVYVGANDGMIHAFLMAKWDDTKKIWLNKRGGSVPGDPTDSHDPDIGKELWAYIPSNLLTELQYLAPDTYGTIATAGGCIHRSMVDLAPQSWEVYIKPPGASTRSWRTVILGGERGGGDVYFAVDVTDPHNPQVLWEYSMLKNRIVYDKSGTRSLANCATGLSDANCKAANLDTAYLFIDSTMYEQLKVLPVAWSRPTVGRFRIPTAVDIYKLPTSTTVGLSVPSGLTSWGTSDWDDKSPWPQNGYHQPRHVAFIGGGIRIFQDDTTVKKDPSVNVTIEQLSAAKRFDLFRPELMAIDIETGRNLLTYYWPKIQDQTAFRNLTGTNADKFYKLFPIEKWGSNYIPYSMADPLALDVLNDDAHAVGDDGYVDTIYAGDLLGNFYGIKFNFNTQVVDHANPGSLKANTYFGMRVDWWQTKQTWEGNPATKTNVDYFRGQRQPITVPPVARVDADTSNGYFLHVIFGAGKFEDIPDSTNDDMIDPGRTSIYNLKDLVEPTTDIFFDSAKMQTVGNFNIELNPRCPQANTTCASAHVIRDWPKSGEAPCTWTRDNGSDTSAIAECCRDTPTADCCMKTQELRDCGEANCSQPGNPSNSCTDPCWNCIFDLSDPFVSLSDLTKPGERVVRKALIAGGLVFITTYAPPESVCETQGTSMLYVLSYDCGPIPGGLNIFDSTVTAIGLRTGLTNTYDPRGWKLGLGSGVASNPVLDSTGTHVIIQMSTGDIKNFNVNLPLKVLQPVGWRER